MRSRVPLYSLLLLAGSLVVPVAAHAAIPFFGPIIDPTWLDGSTQCPLGMGALMMVINNIISLALTIAIVFIAPLMIAYSGFLYVANSVNPSGISQAKSILIHTVVGIVIALAAWMIVDAVMAALYNQSLGTWSTLVKGDGHVPCVPQAGVAANTYSQATGAGPNGGGTTAPKSDARTLTQLNAPDGACNPVTVENAFLASSPHNAPVATPSQAKFLACIAQGESTCGQLLQNFNWGKLVGTGLSAKASSAYGPYQVLLASNHECYEYAACYVAAGLPADGSTKLDCQNAFEANGMPIAGPLLDKCKLAAGNKQCSATAAVCLLNKQSISKAYGTDPYVASCQAASQ